MRKNRQISWILTLVFMFSIIFSLPAVPVVAGCQDISGHWAESQIESLMSQNIINGYPDNTFRSENPISRAEFIVITNKAFNFSDSTAINYSDVKPTDWFAADIARAKAAGYISGYEDGTMKPNQQISRQEAASIVARILSLQPVDTTATLQRFSDGKTIANWSRDSIAAMIENGYLKGYPDNTFKPTNSIKRAEAAVLFKIVLDSERDAFKPEPKPEVQSLFDQAGTYGPETGTLVINKDVTISASGVTLQNLIIEKDLIIAKEVGDGDVTLNNVTVKGKTYVRGGGKDSIHINGGQYSEIIIEKTATGEVRIVAVDTTGLRVTISENAKGEEIILNGDFKSVTVNADDVNLTTQSETSIGELKVESGLKDVNIELAKDSTVKEIVLNSKTDVEGKGTIEKASGSKAKESSYATQPGSITTPSTSSGSGGGGGGGGGGDSTVAVSAISVEPKELALTVGETGQITATVEPSNASNKKVNWTTSDAKVATVDANGYVTAKKVGTATITATSAANSSKKASCEVTVVSAGNYIVTVDGISKEASSDSPLYEENGRLWAPLRFIAEALSIEIEWDADAQKAIFNKDETTIEVGIDSEYLVINNGRTFGDLGYISEGLGYDLTWNLASRTLSFTTVEAEPIVIQATLISTSNVGIAPDTAGEAAGNIYAEYKLVAGENDDAQTISLAKDKVEYIKVKTGEGEWKDLTANTDATLWFNVEAETGLRTFEVKTTDGKIYTAKLNWDKEIKEAIWQATGGEGDHEGVTYVEYKLMDGTNPISLKEGEVKLIASEKEGKWVALEPNTDATLWFNKAKETGNYDFFVVTKDGVMYKATLDWTETIAADVDYNAVWNETRGTWYIKVSVPEESLDAASVTSINVIKEAGEELTEPRTLTPDTDKVLWFGVAKGDGNTSLKTAGEYAYEVVRKDGTKYIFNFTYAPGSVTGVSNLVQAALDVVNNAKAYVSDENHPMRDAIEANATVLGLATGEGTTYYGLVDGRKRAVNIDLYDNKPAGGYDLETLQVTFDEIVATRLVFEQSVAKFAAASVDSPLTDLSYITMLITNLEGVQKQTQHSGRSIKDDILPELNGLVTDFGKLTTEQQTAVLKTIDYSKSTSSTATRNALRTALNKYIAYVSDASGITTALGNGDITTIKFAQDITLDSTITINKDVVIDGQGKKLSGAFFNVQSGNVVFDNVKFQGAGSSGSQDAIQVQSGASATVKGCEFNGLYRGINAYFGSTITIQNNNFTDVYRCIIAGMGPAGAANVSVGDISGNTFNLGFERNNTGKYARGVSYNTNSTQSKGSLSAAVSHMLTNNTFTGDSNVDLDHQVRFYSGYQSYVNHPITDGTSDNVTVVDGTASEVIPSDDQRELVLGKITVGVSDMTVTALTEGLTKADFVESITVKDSSGNTKSDGTIADNDRVYIKSKDGKDTNYYIVKVESAEANGEAKQGTNGLMMQVAPIMNAEDPVTEEPLEIEDETEVTTEEATESDEATTDGAVEEEVNGEEITEETAIETDETQLEGDKEVAVEAENAEDTSEGI